MNAMAQLRRTMVDCQLRTYDVTQLAVLDAFETVPRDAFVPESLRPIAYLDRPLALGSPSGRTLLTPMVVARMIQTLAVTSGERVIDYAGGTGYSAAILAHLGANVTLVEPDKALAATARQTLASVGATGVTVVESLSGLGGDFQAVLVNGACDMTPKPLVKLLCEGGRMIYVEGQGRSGRVMLAQKAGGRVSERTVFDASAPVLKEFAEKPEFAL